MRQKFLIALLAVTAAAVVVAVFSSLGGGPNSDPRIGQPVLTDLAPHLAEVGQVALMHGESKTTLARRGDRWVVAERDDYPADAAKLRQLLLGLAALAYVEPKTKEAKNYPKLQVEDAGAKDSKSTLVTVSGAQGSLLGELIAGKRVTDALGGGDDGVYVRKPGDAQSWLARGTLDLSDTPGWLDPALLDLPAAGVKEALFSPPEGSPLSIARDKPEDKFHLGALPKDNKLRGDDALYAAAGALAGLQLSDVKPDSDFAWPKTGESRARFTFFDGLVVTVEIVDVDKTGWARFTASGSSAESSAKARELNARTAHWVYALPAYKANLLKTRLTDLLAPAKSS